ncbi:MAG: hypothetical protein MI757_03945 [Pirellulales bacterium]|nr:hypothetical protein [Pirellulales bacterium]
MSDTPLPESPLTEIEARQDEVLRKLDHLNERIESALRQFGSQRATDDVAANPV